MNDKDRPDSTLSPGGSPKRLTRMEFKERLGAGIKATLRDLLLFLGLALSHTVAGLSAVLALMVVLLMLWGLIHWKLKRQILIVLALNPLVLWPLGGMVGTTIDYLRCDARRQVYGGISRRWVFNLDPELRCYTKNHGCCPQDDEWLVFAPSNWTLKVLTRTFGPQRGVWTGPIPTEDEVLTLMRDLPLRSFEEARDWGAERRFNWDGIGLRMFDNHSGHEKTRVLDSPQGLAIMASGREVLLFDPGTGRIVAWYQIKEMALD